MSTREDSQGMLVLAVDDEKHGLEELEYQLGQHPRVRRILLASEAAEALRLISGGDAEVAARRDAQQIPVDAVFIDINMPGLSGTELARVLAALKPEPPAIVFVTGVGAEAVTAFELGAIDYVLKPLKEDRLHKAVDRVWADRQATLVPPPAEQPVNDAGSDEVIPVELAGTTKLIQRSSVRWVEAQGDYARLHTTEGSHLVRIPLAQLEERWSDAGFVRIHRSYLVAQNLITELRMGASGYTVVLDDEQELPVSRRHTRDLKDRVVRSPKNGWN